MDTTLALAPKPAVAAPSYAPEQQPPSDKKVPIVKGLDASATLPAEKPFVAQVVTARLSGTAFPENPGEIVPEERTLRPYDTPMLPSNKDPEEEATAEEHAATEPVKVATAGDTIDRVDENAVAETARNETAPERKQETAKLPEESGDTKT